MLDKNLSFTELYREINRLPKKEYDQLSRSQNTWLIFFIGSFYLFKHNAIPLIGAKYPLIKRYPNIISAFLMINLSFGFSDFMDSHVYKNN